MMPALAVIVLMALVIAACAWLDRKPCPHTNLTRYPRHVYCADCDELLEEIL